MKEANHKDGLLPDSSPRRVGSIFLAFGVLGLLIAILALVDGCSVRAVFTATLWAFACFAAGTLLGFLFGIPKVVNGVVLGPVTKGTVAVASPGLPDPTLTTNNGYRSDPNSNLIEISDWLTKIIVGLGLINLTKIPGHLHSLASILARDLSSPGSSTSYLSYSIALVIAFSILGFLFGYLSTRLYLSLAFNKADQEATTQLQHTQQAAEAAGGAVESLQDQLKMVDQQLEELRGNSGVKVPAETKSQDGKDPVLRSKEAGDETRSDPDPMDQIMEWAQEYVNFRSTIYQERVANRDGWARSIALLINASTDMRQRVIEANTTSHNDGLVAGLADAVNSKPMRGDFRALLHMAQGPVKLKHTMYKVATAIGRLFDERLATLADAPVAHTLLMMFISNAPNDVSLWSRVNRTLAQISRATGYDTDKAPF